MLSTHFDMKDLGEASYVLGIKILRDRANGVLKLSQRAYIERILKRFNMHNCKSTKAPIVKGDKFSKAQCPQNDDEREEMKTIPYSSMVGSLTYAQVGTRPDIAFVVGMLGRYLSNPGSQHWKAAKKVLRRSCILEKCKADTYSILNYGGREADLSNPDKDQDLEFGGSEREDIPRVGSSTIHKTVRLQGRGEKLSSCSISNDLHQFLQSFA
ncbi:Retrovirus-related Pol polyprotein from transposon TNT 1-94 [Vitis vinifera]|uniref:Retrovirus-related Pol polyprotein from transposon TNT 1-94 n=1 Tax=Vitis vinifera TaxID=29760 RepID=A0A438EP48_VITVI|nr:Retrovirus-related Pol polyprotein from transposon TNT 1-94 [Vitis vinifera]